MVAKHTFNEAVLEKTVRRCQQQRIIIPTFAEQKNPNLIPEKIKKRLTNVGLWDVDPLNLFRITWKNEPKAKGGLFGNGNYVEFPSSLTGVDARIIGLVGKYFPTGSHKVGPGFSCLVPRLITGEFDPETQKAVWPSTGNYCRGGAFDCALLGCNAIAILPEEMSPERFAWLRSINTDEIIATPGCESNVKEIYDMCWKLHKERGDKVHIFNQFEEFNNSIWHYHMTGSVIAEIFEAIKGPKDKLSAFISATGSAGTISAGDYLRTVHPHVKVVATEALQCPTLLRNGYGGHRIEGIGDKHIPWVHNVRNTDMVVAVDDEQCMSLMRLFNEDEGKKFLTTQGIPESLISQLPLLGISGLCNMVAAVKTAKYFDMGNNDVIFIPMTDSMEMYVSRQEEQRQQNGPYNTMTAARHFGRYLEGTGIDNLRELSYLDRKGLHNLKYYTWVEQQGKSVEELNQLWDPDFWMEKFASINEWDTLIREFNERTGVLANLD